MEQERKVEFIKCSSCGANMEFNPETQMLYCPSCKTEKDFEKDRQVAEIAIAEAFAEAQKPDTETKVYKCANCGAEVVINADEVASECPFCSTPYVVDSEQLSGLKPSAVYPFTFDKEEALSRAKTYIKKRLFCPKKFKKNIDAKSVKGMYLPCFTFDSDTSSSYHGRIGKRHTRTVRTRNGTRTETYVVWRNVSGSIRRFFDDITISATSKIEDKVFSKIQPFNRDTICVYEKNFLSGFFASHYEKDIQTAWQEAQQDMDKIIRREIIAQYNCDEVAYLNVTTAHNNVTYKYVFFPIYMISYKYKKKDYGLVLNGNTGRATGKLPVSPLRVGLATLIGGGLLALFAWLVMTFL